VAEPSIPVFVGRNDELVAFKNAVAEASQGVPAVLLVSV
jgi:hypothetical protein